MSMSLTERLHRLAYESKYPEWVKGDFELENAWSAGFDHAWSAVMEMFQAPPKDLQESFAYYTECQLATVEGLQCLKRPPKHELERHRSIADGMVAVCRQYGIRGEKCGRLDERLDNA